jgi:hypothetical protein
VTPPKVRNASKFSATELPPGAPIVLAYGAGVNSTALLLRWVREGHRLDAVLFADPGEENPKTIDFLNEKIIPFLKEQGIRYERLESGLGRLVDHYTNHAAMPSIQRRDCTSRFKIAPMERWIQEEFHPTKKMPVVTLLGIDYGEIGRVKDSGRGYVVNCYPLVGWKMNREACRQEIAAAGLPIPVKSGCRMCIFANESSFIRLARDDPTYFARVQRMEEVHAAARKKRGKEPMLLIAGKPLDWIRREAKEQHLLQPFEDDTGGDCGGYCRT